MKCNNTHTKLIFYLDGELDQQESKAIQAHLQECETCHALYSQLKSTLAMAKAPEPSAGFTNKVMEQVFPDKQKSKQFINFTRRIAAAILFLLISSSAVIVLTESRQAQFVEEQTVEEEFVDYYFADLDSYDLDNYYTTNEKSE